MKDETLEYYETLLERIDIACDAVESAMLYVRDRVRREKLAEIETMLSNQYDEVESEQEGYLERVGSQ